ncbi:MAG: ATP-binding protein [Candidatus Omnitrophica bacterium]|nr:ATP-binding protein [Candidatus Omnitrophota bacterium]
MDIRIAFSRIAVYAMILALVVGMPIGFLLMNLFALAGLTVGVFCFILSFITLVVGKTKLHRLLMLFNIAVTFWGVGSFIAGVATRESIGILGWKIAHFGGFFIGTFFYHLVCVLCKVSRRRVLQFAYTQAILFNILNLCTPYLINKTRVAFGIYYNEVTPLLLLGIICYVSLIVLSYFELTRFLGKSRGTQRTQALYIIFGFLCGFIGGTSTFLPEFGIDIFYPFGNFGIVLYACVVTYAILKFRLLNINIALTRAGIFVFVYTLVLGLPFALATWGSSTLITLFGGRWWIAPLGLMAALATSGPYIYLYIQHRAEERLLWEQNRYHNTLKQASRGMTRVRNLQRLLNLITHVLTKIVKIKRVAIYLLDEKNGCFVLKSQRGKDSAAYPREINASSPLTTLMSDMKEPFVYDELKQQVQDEFDTNVSGALEQMAMLEANMIVPTFLEDKFLGFLALGDKFSGKPYTPEDINVFSVLASQAALAIENAEFYQEAQEMQEQIAQAEKMATIGTMADGLSHQINNRFHALALISGNTLDTLKIFEKEKGVQGKEMRELFDELEYAFGRVQANVLQGGEIVKGLLKYSKKGEEGFKAVSLSEIIENTLEMVQYKVKLADFELVKDYPEKDHKIYGNLVQLQEVFFNLIDNGYDAIKERKETLKEEGYKGRIRISARPEGKSLEIVVEDNGMGVKEGNLKKMFTPFFTTKATANKGTGLGLYVIRRIISEMHKGSVEVESEHGKGTKFIIHLPLA